MISRRHLLANGCGLLAAACYSTKDAPSLAATPHRESASTMPWLRTLGTQIVDEKGNPVVLQGINLGGWLVEEMWMLPFITEPPSGSDLPPIRDHVSLWNVLQTRLGKASKLRLMTAWRDHWITEEDFRRIRDIGFNCVRLPFLHDLFEEESNPWLWLDKAVGWAGKYGLYVVLDMHGAPGRQSRDHHTGEEGRNRFFYDPSYLERAENLWRNIAARYRDRPEIAGYDLLNEPMGAPNTAMIYLAEDRLYQAIRSVDKRHLLFFEDGYTGLSNMPYPNVLGWTNAVLSAHSYQFQAKSAQDHLNALRGLIANVEQTIYQQRKTPFYLGEFNLEPHGTPQTLVTWAQMLNAQQISWSLWTYKVTMRNGDTSMWGLYHNTHPIAQPLDPYRDSESALIAKMDQVKTANLEENTSLTMALQQALKAK
ncbi:glycoside hydrolase family 5 protein [Chthonomonas calidirosea]|uniref:glycoside hydrolase family 5 protein n=1 Tax=Chthonomonas calidirosea TaxID=454171 RepID=UPI0006ECB56B|nr:cellulase family glycosylhydrolase [Chthonomonas calidirosea]CEK17428.1 endoglucanase [Chthonomonas calidirosea]